MNKAREIYKIEANKNKKSEDKLRVAAYCRVSTDSKDQTNSFIAQIRYYNDYIRNNPDMILVDVYADEGITGTSRSKRDEFNRMMKDCKAGKIDRILVKSVSRFARNSLECIEAVRELKKYGTTVFFENDGIDTNSMNHEFILYVKGAFAQSESMSASKRVRRSNQMRMENCEFTFVNAPFGYRVVDGTLIPVKEEVEVVREIYCYYLSGMGIGKIVMELNSKNAVGSPWGKERVRYILSNEKYIGDTLHQKTYTPEILPFRNRINRGEADKYYVSNTHEAILDKDTFNKVQAMIRRNLEKEAEKSKPKKHNFSGKIYCFDCGWCYKRRVQNGKVYWLCSKNGVAGRRCSTHTIREEGLEKTFCEFYNKLQQHKDEILKSTLNRLIELKGVITKSKSEIAKIDEEILNLSDKISYFSNLLNNKVIDSLVCDSTITPFKSRIAELRDKRSKLLLGDDDEKSIDELRGVISFLNASPMVILKYDHKLFEGIVQKIIVKPDRLVFKLKSGMTFEEAILWN